MAMKDLKITEFVNKLASKEPTPGGGAAAGVAASLGAGAILMAMYFSEDKKGVSDEDRAFFQEKVQALEASKDTFIQIIDRDATDFEPLSQAYGMPRETDEDKASRAAAIQDGLVTASQPPLDLIHEVEAILQDFDRVIPLVKKLIISDVGVGLQLLRSAVNASSLNLLINGSQLKDPDTQAEYMDLATTKVQALSDQLDRLYNTVVEILKG